MKEVTLTPKLLCGHCNIKNRMRLKTQMSDIHEVVIDSETMHTINAGPVFEMCYCSSCDKINVFHTNWNDFSDPRSGNFIKTRIYPQVSKIPMGLNDDIAKAYTAAQKVKGVDANAYVVLIRRLLEMVCLDREADGRDLYNKLNFLAEKGEIPSTLSTISHHLRSFGNIGAHAGSGNLTDTEVELITMLTNALLEYIYTAPYLADLAERQLAVVESWSK